MRTPGDCRFVRIAIEGSVIKPLGLEEMTGSSSSMEVINRPLASYGFDGITT